MHALMNLFFNKCLLGARYYATSLEYSYEQEEHSSCLEKFTCYEDMQTKQTKTQKVKPGSTILWCTEGYNGEVQDATRIPNGDPSDLGDPDRLPERTTV